MSTVPIWNLWFGKVCPVVHPLFLKVKLLTPILKYLEAAVAEFEIFRVGNIEVDTAARDMAALHKNHRYHHPCIIIIFNIILSCIDIVIITSNLHVRPVMLAV